MHLSQDLIAAMLRLEDVATQRSCFSNNRIDHEFKSTIYELLEFPDNTNIVMSETPTVTFKCGLKDYVECVRSERYFTDRLLRGSCNELKDALHQRIQSQIDGATKHENQLNFLSYFLLGCSRVNLPDGSSLDDYHGRIRFKTYD